VTANAAHILYPALGLKYCLLRQRLGPFFSFYSLAWDPKLFESGRAFKRGLMLGPMQAEFRNLMILI